MVIGIIFLSLLSVNLQQASALHYVEPETITRKPKGLPYGLNFQPTKENIDTFECNFCKIAIEMQSIGGVERHQGINLRTGTEATAIEALPRTDTELAEVSEPQSKQRAQRTRGKKLEDKRQKFSNFYSVPSVVSVVKRCGKSDEKNLNPMVSDIPQVKREKDKWFSQDKFWHWAMSFTLVGSSYHLLYCRLEEPEPRATAISLSFTLSCGLAKEFYDSRNPRGMFSVKDLIYDLLGIATGYLVFIR